jgi:Icc-related predicted phosphoesterase
MRKIKLILQYIKSLLLIKIISLISFGIYNYKNNSQQKFSPYSQNITKIKVRDGKLSKIGIISDLQLKKNISTKFFNYYAYNVYRALNFFKKNDIDIIIMAGDITNGGEIINYLYFKEIYYSVYENTKRPILIPIMGNHDYIDDTFSKLGNQKKFFKYMNSYPFSHYLINNYNFIFWSYSFIRKRNSKKEEYSWLKSRIENARKNINKVGDPIFIISHMPPLETVYGSENILGDKVLYDILKNYPEVISISAHSHYS